MYSKKGYMISYRISAQVRFNFWGDENAIYIFYCENAQESMIKVSYVYPVR